MKKTGCVLLAGLCAVLLTACGSGTDAGSLSAAQSSTQQGTGETRPSELVASASSGQCSSTEDGENTEVFMEDESSGEESEGEVTMQQNTFYVRVGEETFSATFADNSGAQALKELLADGDVTIQMSDYGGFEKVGALGQSLPTENSQTTTQAGDIVLYQGDQIVIFYGFNSWSYTRLGRIDDLTGWQEALGSGDLTVTFSMEKE